MGITPKLIEEHYEIRAALESEACAIICRKKRDIAEIIKIHEESKEAILSGDVNAYSDFNQAFHFAIWNACDNARLIDMASSLWNGLSISYLQTEEQYAKVSIEEHDDIVAALIAYDEESSRKTMLQAYLSQHGECIDQILKGNNHFRSRTEGDLQAIGFSGKNNAEAYKSDPSGSRSLS